MRRRRILSAAHGHGASEAGGGLDTGNIVQAIEHLAINASETVFIRIPRAGKPELKHQDAVGIEAGIDLEQMEKCADKQTGSDDEDERERNLGDEQRAADFLAARPCPGTLSAFFECFNQIFAGGPEGGSESEKQPCDERDGERECEYARIEPDFVEAGNIQRAESFDKLNSEFAKKKPENPADERE